MVDKLKYERDAFETALSTEKGKKTRNNLVCTFTRFSGVFKLNTTIRKIPSLTFSFHLVKASPYVIGKPASVKLMMSDPQFIYQSEKTSRGTKVKVMVPCDTAVQYPE